MQQIDEIRLRGQMGLVTEAELAAMLGITDHTLQYWRTNGGGPRYVKLGKTVYYRTVDIKRWIDANVLEVGESQVA